jgi:coenzyme F420 hydrogenase subunit beta
MASLALPLLELTPTLAAAPARDLCTDCGISRSSHHASCGKACQFIHPQYEKLERQVHGRTRAVEGDEAFFGPFRTMHRARMRAPREGAQWTGITTRLGERLLEEGMVDAVIATASDPADRWKPAPAIITRAEDMELCRGMKMGYSPVLALLDECAARGYKRIAMIGVACQVHALRALEQELGLEALYVIGTPCSDNTTTENFHTFLGLLTDRPDEVTYLEFLSDFRVELRLTDGSQRFIPFMQLPIRDLPRDFFPLTCRSCFDYTNSLSDITVGYMAGEGEQWLLVRTARGEAMLQLLREELALAPLGSAGARKSAVQTFVTMLEKSAGGLPVRGAPDWARPVIGWMQRRFGPKGLEFARTRVEMKMTEGIINLRAERPRRMKRMIPDFAWRLAAPYGLAPRPGEQAET